MDSVFENSSQSQEVWMLLADSIADELPVGNETICDQVTPFDLDTDLLEDIDDQSSIGESFVSDLLSAISQSPTRSSLDGSSSISDVSQDLSDLISCSDATENTDNVSFPQSCFDDGYGSLENLTSTISGELSHDELNALLDSIVDTLPKNFSFPSTVLDDACCNLSQCSSPPEFTSPVQSTNYSSEMAKHSTIESHHPDLQRELEKPEISYIELVAKALMNAPSQGMLLCDIYQWIEDCFPYYKDNKSSWRNSIRHNLSVNECFVKGKRARNGRGFYWSIHSSCIDAFKNGDFDRRKARRQVQECNRAFGSALEELKMLKQIRSQSASTKTLSQPLASQHGSHSTLNSQVMHNAPLNSTPIRYEHLSTIQPVPSYGGYHYPNSHYHNTNYYC